jgi:uncharacterized repeat protein (TIGR03803 family)
LTTIFNFGAPVYPTNLIAGPNGVLYGAADGGANGRGYVYQLNPPAQPGGSWTQTVLYSLTTSDGDGPTSLAQSPRGSLVGATGLDGATDQGTIFEVSPGTDGTWSGKTLYKFTGSPDGSNPAGSLAFGPNGKIYGATIRGGSSTGAEGGSGTVFELKPPAQAGSVWTEDVLYRFTGLTDGSLPYGGVLYTSIGSLLGTTGAGGASGFGTVFELEPPGVAGGNWTEKVLHSFGGGSDARAPKAGLIGGPKGQFYGTTYYGGSSGEGIGTVFELTPPSQSGAAWTERVLYSFESGFPGAGYYPAAPLVRSQNGTLFGTTCCGGPSVYGVVFELTPPTLPSNDWTETVLWGFLGGADGGSPYTGLTLGQDGILYGTTTGTGVSPFVATLFAVAQ